MHLRLLTLLIFLQTTLLAQKDSKLGVPYSYCNWTNTSLNKNYIPTENDTCLFVVSTRNYNDTLKEFVDYDYDTTGTLKYFAIYYKGNNWTAVPYSSLAELLNLKSSFKNLVVFTEGLGKTFTSGIDRATKVMRTYGVDEIFFDWPTDRPYMRSGKNIKVTCYVAPKVAVTYVQFLEEFQTYKINHPQKFKVVTLFFHSMGNLLLMYDLRGASIIFGDHQLGEKPKKEFCEKANYVNFSKVLDKEHNYYVMQPLLSEKPFLQKFYANIFEDKVPELNYPETLIKKK